MIDSPAQDQLRTQVRDTIKACGLKQIWIANQLGISEKHLSQLLTGRVTLTLTWAERILAACGKRLVINVRQQRTAPQALRPAPEEQP